MQELDILAQQILFGVRFNLPFGVLTVLGLSAFMKESVLRRDVPFAWFGFLSLSLGIGALQMMLDRGERAPSPSTALCRALASVLSSCR